MIVEADKIQRQQHIMKLKPISATFLFLASLQLGDWNVVAQPPATDNETAVKDNGQLVPRSALILARADSSGDDFRRGFSTPSMTDPVHAALINGTLADFCPNEGDMPPGQSQWQWKQIELDENGSTDQRGLYLYVPLRVETSRAMVLTASGQGETYFNGEIRCGNVYGRPWVRLPVFLHAGTNSLVLRAGRGSFKVRLDQPPARVFLNSADKTLPDLPAGQAVDTWVPRSLSIPQPGRSKDSP